MKAGNLLTKIQPMSLWADDDGRIAQVMTIADGEGHHRGKIFIIYHHPPKENILTDDLSGFLETHRAAQ